MWITRVAVVLNNNRWYVRSTMRKTPELLRAHDFQSAALAALAALEASKQQTNAAQETLMIHTAGIATILLRLGVSAAASTTTPMIDVLSIQEPRLAIGTSGNGSMPWGVVFDVQLHRPPSQLPAWKAGEEGPGEDDTGAAPKKPNGILG